MSGAEREGDPTRNLALLALGELAQIHADTLTLRNRDNWAVPDYRRSVLKRMEDTLTRLRAWSDLLEGEGR